LAVFVGFLLATTFTRPGRSGVAGHLLALSWRLCVISVHIWCRLGSLQVWINKRGFLITLRLLIEASAPERAIVLLVGES